MQNAAAYLAEHLLQPADRYCSWNHVNASGGGGGGPTRGDELAGPLGGVQAIRIRTDARRGEPK